MTRRLDHTEAIAHLSSVDRKLAKVIAKAGPCGLQPENTQSIFEALLESIIYQQLNGKVAATITNRVKALFPENTRRIRTRHGEAAAFPSPEQVLAATPELLRSAGLSQNKMLAIRDLAAKALDGTVPTVRAAHRMSDDELVEHLTQVRGIGWWTVEMLLIFRLGRPDVLAVDDYGVRKGFAKMMRMDELPKPKELQAYGERWRPHRSVACWYMWRAAEDKSLPEPGAELKKIEAAKKKAAMVKASQKKAKNKVRKSAAGRGGLGDV
jgi:3-methyladenine DNA glycosylase/8-oxoguanine DNA glycosylase